MEGTWRTSKAQLLDDLKAEQAQWEALLQVMHDIGEDNMTQPGVPGAWSIKDLVAHLNVWQRRSIVERLRAARRNEPLPPPPWPAHLGTEDEIDENEPHA